MSQRQVLLGEYQFFKSYCYESQYLKLILNNYKEEKAIF